MERRLDREKYPEYVYPEHKPDHSKPERESIVKLGKMITDRIPQKLGIKKITRDDPEYWGLAGVVTDEEAEIAGLIKVFIFFVPDVASEQIAKSDKRICPYSCI